MKPYLNTHEAAEYLGWKIQTLERRRWLGLPPKYYKAGRSIRYKLKDLEKFVEAAQ